MNHVIYSKR
uniref:Uncharacterized protein n=1 Tax=Anguilla anguilla TaxID=7936 RepID=A0A0E9XHR7_ANGAN